MVAADGELATKIACDMEAFGRFRTTARSSARFRTRTAISSLSSLKALGAPDREGR